MIAPLDDRPLPDEHFDWTPIADDVHDKVADVLGLCDGCCDELLDVEYRMACRRLPARVAAGDPAVFRARPAPSRRRRRSAGSSARTTTCSALSAAGCSWR